VFHAILSSVNNTKRQFLKFSALGSMAASVPCAKVFANSGGGASASQKAAHALNRLGFGPRPTDLAAVASDPMSWVEQQLTPNSLEMPGELIGRLNESLFTQMNPTEVLNELSLAQSPLFVANETRTEPRKLINQFNAAALQSRLQRALESPRQLEEVMVDFWFNHFNVFQGKNLLRIMMGHYEHYAIRPFALGRFRDLLGATAHHPAMLYFLDNASSVAAQKNRARGLNENYARELMELHTLGASGGYSQKDVTELARMLTGWSIIPLRPQNRIESPQPKAFAPGKHDDMPGFWFNPKTHDNGDKSWLEYSVSASGKSEGDFALDILAKHPATATHIAFKLAQYFVHDQPDPKLVEKLSRVFLEQDGQIVPVLRTLFQSSQFWDPSVMGAKFKTPYHFSISSIRALGASLPSVQGLANQLALQGQPLYGCQTPDGYKNTESAWLNADAMIKRIQFATRLSQGKVGMDTVELALDAQQLAQSLGPLISAHTQSVARSHQQENSLAIALILAGPNMMRR
jgi:uncharacterized protein (DUF1800 family)